MELKLMTVQEVGTLLGCSRTTIWRRVQDGTLPKPIKIGGITRWRSTDLYSALQLVG